MSPLFHFLHVTIFIDNMPGLGHEQNNDELKTDLAYDEFYRSC